MATASDDPVFALLDDAEASAGEPASRLYRGFVHQHRCVDPATLDALGEAVERDLAAGRHAVLVADYEWGVKLQRAGCAALGADDRSSLRVLVFSSLERLDAAGVDAWLAAHEGRAAPSPAGTVNLQPSISREAFDEGIARIHEAIRNGETYQVNFTYRIRGEAWGPPLALYRRLRGRQRVGYGALIRLPQAAQADGGDAEANAEWILSRSPELFVRHAGGMLEARPMKGTAVRAVAPEGDSETARLLHEDTKNRAENLMIVDLLRNDLSRVAVLGSVRVSELFAIEPYATVFQMTSTIRAECRPEVTLAELLRAVYPCGSITGAPKHRTMEWIAALETTPRGLYTGAIGWLDAPRPGRRLPELGLSVAIRTLALGAEQGGARPLAMGVGGGIVLDSVAADEYEETRWKARFVTALDPGIALFETMRATREGGVAHLARHRARLAASAAALGFSFDASAFDAVVSDAIAGLAHGERGVAAWRLRVALAFSGAFDVQIAPLPPLASPEVFLRLEPRPLAAHPLSRHKTTLREAYDAGIRAAEAEGAFDSLFLGEDGRLIEGGRSNVFVRLDGRWFTPPVEDGALPGVMRSVLLEDAALAAGERRLTLDDLRHAQAILVCNALRGVLPAQLPANDAAHAEPVRPDAAAAASNPRSGEADRSRPSGAA